MQIRRDKCEYEADGIYPFGPTFCRKDYKDIKEDFFLKYDGQPVVIAGRLMTICSHVVKRHLQNIRDKSGDIQVYFVKVVYWAKMLINTLKCWYRVISSA